MEASACKKAEVIEVIKVIVMEGTGNTKDDPIKEVVHYWSIEGQHLFKEEITN